MNTLFNKIASALSGVVVFFAACVMAGIGFAALGILALFALVAVGVALLAAPFAKAEQPEADDAEVTA